MVVMDEDHPDILEFIATKSEAEKVARALIGAGYDSAFNAEGGAYDIAPFQNANHSVRFHGRPSGPVLDAMSKAAWECGDPGIQYEDTINAWHTLSNTGPITASNPCSEFLHLDNTSCNLASVNLLKFYENGTFQTKDFVACVKIMTQAMDILVDMSSYPTEEIARRTKATRPLGVGYTNLGALLMAMDLPYDSEQGRGVAAGITSLMTATVYEASADLATKRGPFAYYPDNRDAMLAVIKKHEEAEYQREGSFLHAQASTAWAVARHLGYTQGFRNSQATVLAPTGTISFMMDCLTTGIEPMFAPNTIKTLVGGGTVAQDFKASDPKSLVYQCAMPTDHLPALSPEAHLQMMAAVQPFLSGGISKTINMPKEATVADIKAVYIRGYDLGLKCVAIYRDGCKESQPLSVVGKPPGGKPPEGTPIGSTPLPRTKLPATRRSITHKFTIAGHEGYLTVGLYEDDRPGEIFCRVSKEGSTLSGLLDAWATSISLLLQYGAPLEDVIDKFKHTRYEPSGMTENADIRFAKSITDYIARFLEVEFAVSPEKESEGSTCPDCGSLTIRTGTCDTCPSCGYNGGCG
jgi:ribonucleoside-diphosphate reductase alpha chain